MCIFTISEEFSGECVSVFVDSNASISHYQDAQADCHLLKRTPKSVWNFKNEKDGEEDENKTQESS